MQVFVSYKRSVSPDHRIAEEFEKAATAAGHSVFRDATGIASGAEWTQTIQKAIDDCDVVLCIVSNAALRSNWVVNEIDYAIKRNKLVIPLLVEKLDESLEFQIYIPRFLKVQFSLYEGDIEETVARLCERLNQRAPEVDGFEARFYLNGLLQDESNAPNWRRLLDQHCRPTGQGAYVLTPGACYLLAISRTSNYEDFEGENGKEEGEFLACLRRGVFSRVVTGQFGLSGFAGDWEQPRENELSGYAELASMEIEVQHLQQKAEHLRDVMRYAQVRYEHGIEDSMPFDTGLVDTQVPLCRAGYRLEGAIEQFSTLALGVPSGVEMKIDTSGLPSFASSAAETSSLSSLVSERSELGANKATQDILNELEQLRSTAEKWNPASVSDEAWDFGPENLDEQRKQIISRLDDAIANCRRLLAPGETHPAIDQLPTEEPFSSHYSDDKSSHLRYEIQNLIDEISLFRLEMSLAMARLNDFEIELNEATAIAFRLRPDRGVARKNVAFERAVRKAVRQAVLQLRNMREELPIWKQASVDAFRWLKIATLRFAAGMVRADEKAKAAAIMQTSLKNLSQACLRYVVAELQLHREMGNLDVSKSAEISFLEKEPSTLARSFVASD